MSKAKIFLAAPISGFKSEFQYKENRKNIINLIDKLRVNHYVYSEVLNIESLSSYEEPAKSAVKDFAEISESDVFIIFHPMKMQTSTLIELGYALAKEKKIIVIAKPDVLPYLVYGLPECDSNVKIILASELDESIFGQVEIIINEFSDG